MESLKIYDNMIEKAVSRVEFIRDFKSAASTKVYNHEVEQFLKRTCNTYNMGAVWNTCDICAKKESWIDRLEKEVNFFIRNGF